MSVKYPMMSRDERFLLLSLILCNLLIVNVPLVLMLSVFEKILCSMRAKLYVLDHISLVWRNGVIELSRKSNS